MNKKVKGDSNRDSLVHGSGLFQPLIINRESLTVSGFVIREQNGVKKASNELII